MPTGSPDGAFWSEPAVITCAGRISDDLRTAEIWIGDRQRNNVTPAHRQPSAATTKSTELPISRATRSPGSTPFWSKPAATSQLRRATRPGSTRDPGP